MGVLKIGSSGVFLDPIHKNLSAEEYHDLSRAVDTSRYIHRNGTYREIEFFLRINTADICDEDLRALDRPLEPIYDTVCQCLVRSRPNERCKAVSPLVRVLVDCVRDWYDEPNQPLRGDVGEGWIDVQEIQAVQLTYEHKVDWLFKLRTARDCQKADWARKLPAIH